MEFYITGIKRIFAKKVLLKTLAKAVGQDNAQECYDKLMQTCNAVVLVNDLTALQDIEFLSLFQVGSKEDLKEKAYYSLACKKTGELIKVTYGLHRYE